MNELTISLNAGSRMPLYEQIYRYIKDDITKGHLARGLKLPSTRALAGHLGVSRSTVELSYEQLLSEGYIESAPRKGFYVANLEGLYMQRPKNGTLGTIKAKKEETYLYDFTPNGTDAGSFPYNTWRKITCEVLADSRLDLFRSGYSGGEEPLRIAIRNYLHEARGVNCGMDQIVVGAGNEYLLMLLGMILGYGRTIAFENPTYIKACALFKNLSYRVKSIDLDKSGMRADMLDESGADIAYVMPSHQYPLGIVMPVKRRMEILGWAAKSRDRFIIEDDYDSEFRYKGRPIPALQGLDAEGKVIYIGTFSRSIAPAIRVSYMVLPETLAEIYREKCGFLNCTVPKTGQYIIQRFIDQGHFERHLNKMRIIYKSRHDLMLQKLKPLSPVCRVTGENAGVHLLLTFREDMTEEELVFAAAKRGIKVYGLSDYYIKENEKPAEYVHTGLFRNPGGTERIEKSVKPESRFPTVILGYANMSTVKIEKAMEILCGAWR